MDGKMKTLAVASVHFRREKGSMVESGIAITREIADTGNVLLIVDLNGLPVPAPIWNYTVDGHKGAIQLSFPDHEGPIPAEEREGWTMEEIMMREG